MHPSILPFTHRSAVRMLVHTEHVPSCLHKCTIAVKRADPEYASKLREQDILHSHTFAAFMRLLRSEGSVAILGTDKHQRFGILVPMPVHQNGDSSYNVDEFAAYCYVGNVKQVKQYLAGGSVPEEPTLTSNGSAVWQPRSPEGPPPIGDQDGASEANVGLWQPPEADSGSGGGLWQPPAEPESSANGNFGSSSNTGFDAWNPSGGGSEQLSGKKRKLSDASGEEFHADSGAAAADAFYSGLTRSLDTRADSWLYHMRAFNGWVKATQIQELNPKVKGRKARAPLRVLDLACGKGGDLGKWVLHERGVSNYVGVDVARGSLRDAAIRARKMKKLPKCTFTCADLGADVPGRLRSPKSERMQKLLSWSLQNEADFETAEPKFKMVRGGGISLTDKFDVVSIQFAIHYMMSSRKRARRFFQTVSELLEVGGNLIVTTIDARVVLDHILGLGLDLHFDEKDASDKKGEGALVQVGGGACRLQFDGDTVKMIFSTHGSGTDSEDLYGLQYTFTLVEGSDHAAGVGDAVNLPEWLTPIPALKSLAEEAGLELESAENFHEFYNKRRDPSVFPQAHAALYNMKVLNRNGSISPDEWEVSRLYVALKFRKTRESSMTFEDATDEDENGGESDQEVDTGEKEVADLTPAIKAQLMPMAMMKAKKLFGEEWKDLSSEERTRLTQVELEKLAASSKTSSDGKHFHADPGAAAADAFN